MSHPDKWADAVARVLEAETGDLRTLAKVAGADPATLYIGTRLDGVDVRGQDLRGMNLEDIDRSKIKYDDETRFDASISNLPLIYLAELDVDLPSLDRLLRWTPLVFSLDAFEAFEALAPNHAGPIFVLVWGGALKSAERAVEVLTSRGIDHLVVVIDDVRSLRARRAHTTPSLLFDRPLLSVPTATAMLGFRKKVIPAECRDAMWVLADKWAEKDQFFRGRDAWFARARGMGTEPQRDAAAQIFDRLASLALSARRSVVVAPRHEATREGVDIDRAAMKLLDGRAVASVTARSAREDFHLAAFGHLTNERDPREYLNSTVQALIAAGMTAHDSTSGLMIKTRSGWLEVQFYDGRESLSQKGRYAYPGFDLNQIRTVVLSERADISTVADRLLLDGELWVTARDMLALPPDGMELELLLAAQLRRVSRMMNGRPRRLYLEILLRHALRDGTLMVDDAEGLWEALDRPDFSERYELTISKLLIQPYGTTALLRVTPLRAAERRDADTTFDLHLNIDQDGIEIVGRRRFSLDSDALTAS